MKFVVRRKWVVGASLIGFALLNLAAYRQARAFTHFAPPGQRTRPELLSFGQKVEALLAGVDVPRPENRETPRDVGLAYERHVFPGGRRVPLEAWLVRTVDARGTVVLFHGHADKTLRFFAGVGHDSCLRRRPREWKSVVSEFLDGELGSSHPRAGS
jgi:hypothetical protein